MSEPENELEGLTEDEVNDLVESSKARPDEDATSWAARAKLEWSRAVDLAKSRIGLTSDTPSDPGTASVPSVTQTSTTGGPGPEATTS